MRILLVNHSFSGGGAERCVRDLYYGMTQRGHEVHVWIANPSDNLPANVRSICHPWERKLLPLDLIADWTDWRHRGSIQAFKEITSEHFDVVHMHHIGGSWLSLKAMSEACRRVPTVWTHHDEWAVSNGFVCDLNRMISRKQIVEMSVGLYKWTGRSPYHHSFKNTRVGKLIDRYAPQPEMMIAPSHHMARLISECPRFTEIPVKQIYHGLSMLDEPNRLADRQTCRVHMNIPADRKVILMIAANLTDVHKGIGLGLQAIRRIRQSHDTHLILLGRNAESLKRDLDGVHVTTAYAANDAELAQAYRAADVTLIPSLGESLSFVALESLACQTPIVAFKVGGPAEIIGADERGLLAEPYDVDELANNLQHILHRSDLHAKLAQAGCQWVKDNCCMISFLSEIEQCYQTVIERLGH